MATLLDNKPESTVYAPADEAAKHNALIKERYEKLRSTEETQLYESFTEAEREKAYAQYVTPRASAVLAPERPAEVFKPVESEPVFTHTRVDSPLFTTETLERTLFEGREEAAAEAPAPVTDMQATVQPSAFEAVYEMPAPVYRSEEYSLSKMAIGAIAAFGAVVVAMLSVICLNTQNIHKKNLKIRRLEEQRAELESRDRELDERIKEATSFEHVSEWAKNNGFIVD